MKFNPVSKRLYTNDCRLIKKLECRFPVRWEEMLQTDNPVVRWCDICGDTVTDTASFSDEEVVDMVRRDSNACFKVSFDQANITVFTVGSES